MAREPRRTTRGRTTYGARRLPGGAELLYRVRAGRPSALAYGRAAERRRSLTIPLRGAPLRRHARTSRPDRRILRMGHSDRWTALPCRRRLRDRAVDGDVAPLRRSARDHRYGATSIAGTTAVLVAQLGRGDL